MKRLSKAKIKKVQKADAKRARKAEKAEKAANSKVRQLTRQYLPSALGIRIPGFFKIHFRYAKRSFKTWFVLFIAPFLISIISLRLISEKFLELNPSDIQLYIIAFFIIALAFYFAERHRKFRKIYVLIIPALVVLYGLINWLAEPGTFPGNLIKFGVITLIPAWWLGKHASDEGYKALSDGADVHYRPGRDLYMDGHYAEAFTHLEPSAKRGHMKSLYLLGHAYEHGKGQSQDRIKAAKLYDKAGRKGYGKARLAFEDLFGSFSKDEKDQYDTDLGASQTEELF